MKFLVVAALALGQLAAASTIGRRNDDLAAEGQLVAAEISQDLGKLLNQVQVATDTGGQNLRHFFVPPALGVSEILAKRNVEADSEVTDAATRYINKIVGSVNDIYAQLIAATSGNKGQQIPVDVISAVGRVSERGSTGSDSTDAAADTINSLAGHLNSLWALLQGAKSGSSSTGSTPAFLAVAEASQRSEAGSEVANAGTDTMSQIAGDLNSVWGLIKGASSGSGSVASEGEETIVQVVQPRAETGISQRDDSVGANERNPIGKRRCRHQYYFIFEWYIVQAPPEAWKGLYTDFEDACKAWKRAAGNEEICGLMHKDCVELDSHAPGNEPGWLYMQATSCIGNLEPRFEKAYAAAFNITGVPQDDLDCKYGWTS